MKFIQQSARRGGLQFAGALLAGWLGLVQAQPAVNAPSVSAGPGAATTAGIISVREAAARLPAEAFYARPAIESAILSPSGRWLALQAAVAGRRAAVFVFDLVEWKMLGQAASFANADIENIHWVNDERLVFSIEDRTRGSGDQRWWPGLWSVKRDGTELRLLIQPRANFVQSIGVAAREPLSFNHLLMQVPQQEGQEVIVGEYRYDAAYELVQVNAKRLNVETGRVQNLSLRAPDNVWRWWFDASGEPRLVSTRKQGRMSYQWREPKDGSWRVLAEFDALNPPYRAQWVDTRGQIYVTTNTGTEGAEQLKLLDTTTGQPAADALVSTPGFDFWGGAVAETAGSETLGVRAITDGETTVWFSARMKALQAEADARWPGLTNRLSCRRCDSADMTVLMYSHSDREPGQVWVYRAASKEWRKVGDQRPGLTARLMGMTDLERVSARDGLSLPVWITRPAGTHKGPLPTVVLVHGGPWIRGRHWTWSEDAQFLASRGYLVIEPEFRGSKGYGDQLYRAGFKQWGRAMQDDLVDVQAWAVKQGLSDPARVCIAGSSYGGYAVLMGLARDPGLYRCGAAWAAVTDPRLLFEWSSYGGMHTEHRQYTLRDMIGDPVADKAMLESVSPVLLAERIRAPLFLAFGSDDHRVPVVHGERMRDALAAAGRPVSEWVLYAGEGHEWMKLETRLDFARRLEAFLARHLAAPR